MEPDTSLPCALSTHVPLSTGHILQEAFYGKEITLADRNVVESEAEGIYASAKDEDVSFLVVGDPLCATTHTDLIIRARELGVKVRVACVVCCEWGNRM